MAGWSANNRACTTLWATFFSMHQLSTNFDDSGDLAMSDLTYFNPLGSPELRKQQAVILADQLDHIFRIGRGAIYENNVDRTKAMSSMVKILADEKKLLKDLAKTVDDSYKFWGESVLQNN